MQWRCVAVERAESVRIPVCASSPLCLRADKLLGYPVRALEYYIPSPPSTAVVPDFGSFNATYSLVPGATGYAYFGVDAATGGLYVLPDVTLDFFVANAFELDVMVRACALRCARVGCVCAWVCVVHCSAGLCVFCRAVQLCCCGVLRCLCCAWCVWLR
jgi:hypothetical protein